MRAALFALVGAVVGLLAGFLMWGAGDRTAPRDGSIAAPAEQRESPSALAGAAPAPPAPDPAEAAGLEEMRAKLAAEIERARALADEAAALRDGLAAQRAGDAPAEDAPRDGGADDASAGKPPSAKTGGGWIDADILLGAGFEPEDVAALRERFEQIELERLFIRDQATREGWVKKPRFARRMAQLQQRYDALRDEYGDDDYDWILYAMQRPNRVVTKLVMQDSPAQNAGLESGDVILAYDGRKILGPSELQRATTEALAGGSVAIDVLRGDRELRFYLPAGPLGVQLGTLRQTPRRTR